MGASLDKLCKSAARPLFAPICFRLAMAIEQVDWDEMAENAALASFTIRNAQRLFGADLIFNTFDPWLEAEAAGVPIRRGSLGEIIEAGPHLTEAVDPAAVTGAPAVRHAIDVCTRLSNEIGDGVACAGYLTGGSTLLERLYGVSATDQELTPTMVETAVKVTVVIANAYCEGGAGALVVAEEATMVNVDRLAHFEPLYNVARYFDVPIVWLARHRLQRGVAAAIRKAGAAIVAAPGEIGIGGVSAPIELFSNGAPGLGAWLGKHRPSPGSLFVTEWDLPPDISAESVIEVRRRIME